MYSRTLHLFRDALKEKTVSVDLAVCTKANGLLVRRRAHTFFKVISLLGDGVIWYVIMLVLPFAFGKEGLWVSVLMVSAGLLNLTIYRAIKSSTVRRRPFVAHRHIAQGAPVLDEYSFPSGHTLHAVTYGIVLSALYPPLTVLWMTFALLTAVARVILGLHYPSDVLMGAALGAVHGLMLVNVLALFVAI